MPIDFGVENEIPIVDGSFPIPDYDLNRATWERCNHLVHSCLLNLISDLNAQTIAFHENSIGVWNDLKETFSKIDHVRVPTFTS